MHLETAFTIIDTWISPIASIFAICTFIMSLRISKTVRAAIDKKELRQDLSALHGKIDAYLKICKTNDLTNLAVLDFLEDLVNMKAKYAIALQEESKKNLESCINIVSNLKTTEEPLFQLVCHLAELKINLEKDVDHTWIPQR